MSRADPTALTALEALAREAVAATSARPAVLGLCGAQGSGKSTLARALVARCEERGLAAAVLSLDDLYLSREARRALARDVHPLFTTRGVPGTHDIDLGLRTLAALRRGEPARLPRFDKGRDEPVPEDQWPRAPAPCDLLVLEGWCVGARPEPAAALARPVNTLEAQEDTDATWRDYANRALAEPYQALFGAIDRLALLAAPGFEVVARWRTEQEQALRRQGGGPAAMDDAAIDRFVAHYERLTRHILAEMPARADLVLRLDENRAARVERGAAA